jgi:acyl dehydratase
MEQFNDIFSEQKREGRREAMAGELFFEDVQVGADVPTLVKLPTTRQLVMWAGASGDFVEIHYDKDYALANGLPGVIVHGALKAAFLGQLLTDWIGKRGILKELECRYEGLDFPGEDLTCGGKIVEKRVEGKERLVVCEVWTENPRGEKTTTGKAVVALPWRG